MFVESSPRLCGQGQAWKHVDAGERRLENSDGEERTDEKEDRSKRRCHVKGGSVRKGGDGDANQASIVQIRRASAGDHISIRMSITNTMLMSQVC